MAFSRTRRRRPAESVAKPRGLLHPRVQQVGPEHFGIVCFDCAKARSKFLLADLYGRILIPPAHVPHNRPALDAAVARIRDAFATHKLLDGVVAIERTGPSHRLVQRTFAAADSSAASTSTRRSGKAARNGSYCRSRNPCGPRNGPSSA